MGRIRRDLREAFGVDATFVDVDCIGPGDLFEDEIDRALRGAKVMVVVIGPVWCGEGIKRLHDPNDYVRREVAMALSLRLLVIPLLVGGVQLTAELDLSDDTRALVARQAWEVSDKRWDFDMKAVLDAIGRLVPRVDPSLLPGARTVRAPESRLPLKPLLALGALGVVVVSLVALLPRLTRHVFGGELIEAPAVAPIPSPPDPAPSISAAPPASGAVESPVSQPSASALGEALGPKETALFGVSLQTASRATLRRALAERKATLKRTEGRFDIFDSRRLMEDSSELKLGFLGDGRFARAQFTFPSNMNVAQVGHIKLLGR